MAVFMHEMYFDSLAAVGVSYLHSPGVCSAAESRIIFFFVLGTLFGLSSQLLFRTFKHFMPVTDSILGTLLKLSEVKQITENFRGAIYRYYQPIHSKVGLGRIYYITRGLFDLYGITSEQAIEDPAYSGGDKRPKSNINKGFEDSDLSKKSRAY